MVVVFAVVVILVVIITVFLIVAVVEIAIVIVALNSEGTIHWPARRGCIFLIYPSHHLERRTDKHRGYIFYNLQEILANEIATLHITKKSKKI